MTGAPGFWMWETSGVLRPAVEAYLRHEPLAPADIAALRAYLRQWIMASVWDQNPHATPESDANLAEMRAALDGLTSRSAIERWLDTAIDYGIDPL